MIFEGSKRDLERLDALHLTAWQALAGGVLGGLTRVRSSGRMHVWPGDPDAVAALINGSGFRIRLWRTVEGDTSTYFVEVLGR